MVRVVIRLQNHGCRNHPYWWIVVRRKQKKTNGRIIEQIGYWIPQQRKTVQRSIILNSERIKYWLGIGANPSYKIQKFFSYLDLFPPPIIKHGYKTQYQTKPKTTNEFENVNPYLSGRMKYFLNHVLEMEETHYLFRKFLSKNELLKLDQAKPLSYDVITKSDDQKVILDEIERLKNQIKGMELTKDYNEHRQVQLVIQRINQLYRAWRDLERKQVFQEYQRNQNIPKISDKDQLVGNKLSETSLKENLELVKYQEKLKQYQQIAEKHQDLLSTITRDEYKEYLIKNGNFSEVKAETLTRQEFRKAKETGMQVTKQHAIEAIKPPLSMVTVREAFFRKKKIVQDEQVYIPVVKNIIPFPKFEKYIPDEHYEIPKIYDPLTEQNRPYSLPNISDMNIPRRIPNSFSRIKQVTGNKKRDRSKRGYKILFEFSTLCLPTCLQNKFINTAIQEVQQQVNNTKK